MKKTVKIFALAMLLVLVFVVSAFAADFEFLAEELSEIGVFKGTENGYELDREPTRAEAAVVLVRLLGGEEEALSLSYTAPFADVPDWAKPYVQYLYDKGITKGMSETTFGASDFCTDNQYSVFLLRVLGYADGENGDFEYDDAFWFAEELGMVDEDYGWWDGFYRKDVVTMTYAALAMEPKSGETNLLTKLVNDGKIKDAEKLLETFSEHRMVETALKELAESDRVSMDVSFSVEMQHEGATASIKYETSSVQEINRENIDKSRAAIEVGMKSQGVPSEYGVPAESVIKMYYKDGYMYVNTDGKKEKIKASFEDMADSGITFTSSDAKVPICIFASAEKEIKEGNAISYKISDSDTDATITLKNKKLISIEGKKDGMDVKIENIKTDGTVIVRYPGDLHMYEDMTPDFSGKEDFENVTRKGEIIIGMTMYEPLNYLDEETEDLTGFETDFAREVCKRLGIEPVFIEIEWGAKELYLQDKEVDCVWNGMTITEERLETMDFSVPYLTDAYVVIVRQEDAEKYKNSAEGAVILDSDWRFFAGDMDFEYFEGNEKISGGESYEDDLTALKEKECDMVVASAISISDVLKDERFEDIIILPEHKFAAEIYGIGFRKESTLKSVIDGVIKEMQEDGTLLEIAKKYNLEEMLLK